MTPTVPGYFKVNELPPELRAQVDALLAEKGHKDFSGLTAEIDELLAPHELELTISRSAIHRYSQAQRSRIQEIQDATEFARQLREDLGDDLAALAHMGLQLTMGRMFVLARDDDELGLSTVLKVNQGFSTSSNALVSLRKFQDDYEERKAAADQINAIAKSEGLSEEAIARIDAILGVPRED